MPSPFDPVEEPVSAGNPFDTESRPRPQRQSASADGGFRDPKQPGYTFFPTGHVVRDADKKVWDPSTKSWYFMTEHGMSPEYGKASIPEQDDTRLDTLNLLRKIGSPVIPSQPQTQPQQQVQEPSRIGAAEDFVRQLWGKGKATMQKATAGTLHLIGGIQEEAGNLGIGLKKLASGQASQLTPDEARAITTAQASGWQSAAALALHALALAPQWQREAAQTTKGAAESLYQKGVESAAVEPKTAAGKVGAFVGGLAPHLTPLAPLTMAAEAGETGYRSALQEGAENETAILSGLAQAGVAGTLGSINRIGQLSKGGLKAVEPVLSKYPRLWSLLSKEVESGASGHATRWLGNLVRGSAKTSAEFAAGGMGMRGIAEAAKPQGGSPLSAALEPTEIGKDILTGAAFHALPEVVKAATGPARAAFQERLQRARELRGVGNGPSPEERLAAIKEAEKARVERQVQEAEAAKPKPEAFPEVQPEEVGAYASRELPEEVKAELLRKAQEGQGGKFRYPWEEEGMAPGEEHARSVVDEAARRRQEIPLEWEEAVRRPNRRERLSSLQKGMEEVPSQDGAQDRALTLRDQLQSEFVPGGNTKESIRDLKVREGTRKELANLDAELGALPMQERRQMVADSIEESIREYESQYKMSPGSRRVEREVERLRDEQAKILSGEMPPERVLPAPKKKDVYTPRPTIEEPIAEARTGQERRIAEEPVDIERRAIERRQETKKSIEAEKRPEEMTQAELAELDVRGLKAEEATPETPLEPSRTPQDVPIETQPIAGESRPEEAIPESKNIQPSVEYLNSGLNLQHAIADVLGMKRGSSWSEMAPVAMEKIGRLGKTVAETTVRVMEKIKGITREFAQILAKSLHESFSGTMESQTGALNPEAVKAAREQQRTEREAIKNSGLSKEERREAYNGITKIDTILRNESYPSSTEEATKVADMAASKVLPKGERAAAQVKLAEGMKAGTFPQFSDMKLKADGTPDMGAFLQALQAGFTGDGVMNPDGSKVVIAPMIEHDAAKTAESVRRDLSWIERMAGRIGSTSHVYTGTWSLGTSGEKGAKTIGALEGVNNPATDKHLGMASAFGNTVHVAQHLTDTLTKYSIPNNHFRLMKELKPTNEYWSKAVKGYNAAEESYVKNKSVTTKMAFEIAKEKVADARKVVDSHLREIYLDPLYGDARVMAYADATRGGKAAPEWLESLMSKSEKGAALEITNQMNEIKRALSEAGIPVREDYGVPHTIKAWMKDTDFKRAYDPDTGKISPEALEFKHRSDQSILTMPDAYGMIEDYIPHTMSLIAKRNVANKWDYVARELESTNPRLSEQIKQDMSSYTKGEGAVHEWMDKVNSWFANYLVGYRTAISVRHLAKYPLELANASPIKSVMGWVEFKREVAKNPELKRIMDEMTRAAKGPRYNAYPDLGTGEDVTGVAKGVGQKFSDYSHYPMQFVEGALRSNTFRMDLLGNIKKGMSPREAVADAVFRSLMVNFQASDKPMIMRSSMGRSIFFLQQTVWKIMECNVRAATDAARGIKRGAETTFTGEKLSAEEKGRYSQAARQMAALVAMYYIGKQTNTKLFDWISESPSLIKAIITRPLMVMTKNAVAKAKGEETDWHYDPTDELMSGISATQAFQNIEKSAKEYGFGSKGFWLNLTPLALQDIALEPSKYQQQKTGTGAEALFRRVTGLTKMEEEEEAKEKMQKKTRKKQESKSEKLVQRLRNPLEVIAPAVQESETSPFDKE